MGEDVHTERLVVENFSGSFAGLHVSGRVADQMIKRDAVVIWKCVSAFFWASTWDDVEHLWVVIGDAIVFGSDHAFTDCDSQYGRECRLRGGRLMCLSQWVGAETPLGRDLAVSSDEDTTGPAI